MRHTVTETTTRRTTVTITRTEGYGGHKTITTTDNTTDNQNNTGSNIPNSANIRRVAIFGMPASGKGTLAEVIAEKYNLRHISSGEILRDFFSKHKKEDDPTSEGGFAGDEMVIELLRAEITGTDNTDSDNTGNINNINGDTPAYLLDGFPRNLNQIDTFPIDLAIHIRVDEETAMERMLGRNEGRADDCPESFKNRIKLYKENTEPVIEEFKQRGNLIEIDGNQNKKRVLEECLEKLNRY